MPSKELSQAEAESSPSAHSPRCGILLRDCIIGVADGLTVPFALTAGLSALGDSHLVVMGGLAELLAGAISMGLGAYLAAITEHKQYQVAERKVLGHVRASDPELNPFAAIFSRYGVSSEVARGVLQDLRMNEEMEVQVCHAFVTRLYASSVGRRQGIC